MIGDNIIGSNITRRIAEGLTVATSQTVYPVYGDIIEISESEITDADTYKLFVLVNSADTLEDLMRDTGGLIQSGILELWLFALTGAKAVDALHNLFFDFGYVTEFGVMGKPAYAPWDIGNLTVWKFDPMGGLNVRADAYGNIFVIRQSVIYQIKYEV